MKYLPIVLLLFLAGCDSPAATGPADKRSLTLVSGFAQSDTVLATLAQPLTVRLMVGNRPVAGVEVLFNSEPVPEIGRGIQFEQDGRYFAAMSDTTDAQGFASTRLRFSATRAHTALVSINVLAWSRADTATYEILPGAAASIARAPHAAVSIGDSLRYPAVVRDAYGNLRNDVVDCTTNSSNLRVGSGSGCMLHGQSFGAAAVTLRLGSLSAAGPATVYVVPRGEIAVANYGIELMSIDGRQRRRFITEPFGAIPAGWTATGDSLLYGGANSLRLAAVTGGERALTRAGTWPTMSRDGVWIYYTGVVGDVDNSAEIWRIRRDGTGAERVGPLATGGRWDTNAHVHPAGTLVVYQNTIRGSTSPRVQLLDLATRTVTDLGPGNSPRFSPDGNSIALSRDGHITIISLTGTLIRQYDVRASFLDWSPDGRYIAFSAYPIPSPMSPLLPLAGDAFVMEAATSVALPLPLLSRGGGLNSLARPAEVTWRPD